MKTLDHTAIHRSMKSMGFQLGERVHEKRHIADQYKLTEIQQQFQLEISGVAAAGAWTDFTLNFQEVFYYAPTQRDNPNEDPQVWWGVVFDQGDAFCAVHVNQWVLDDNANYVGAIVRVGVMRGPYIGSGAIEGDPYQGTIHITFQGFGAPVEPPGFDDTP